MKILHSEHTLRIYARIRSASNLSELQAVADKWIAPVVDMYDAISSDPAVEYPEELRSILASHENAYTILSSRDTD